MNLELNKKQFRRLLDLVYIGNWILNSTRGDQRFADYDEVESLLFGRAALEGMPQLAELSPDTQMGRDFDGLELSGGQWQKLAIARALYKDAPFVVLDEPTAALDPISEAEVYTRFHEMVKDKTSIYISHRMASCRFCDDIAVFDEGRLVQRGSHEELVADRDGKYYELWQAQAQYYEGEQSTTRF